MLAGLDASLSASVKIRNIIRIIIRPEEVGPCSDVSVTFPSCEGIGLHIAYTDHVRILIARTHVWYTVQR